MLAVRRVVGDSMAPSLRPGNLVVARRFYWRLRAGDVVIIRHRGLEKIKRIGRIEADQVYLLGDNSAASTDSRDFGALPRSAVVAKLVWPIRATTR